MSSDQSVEFLHCVRRAKERYGFVLDHRAWSRANKEVRMGWADLIEDEPDNNQGIYEVKIGTRSVLVTYCKQRRLITTLLPWRKRDER